MVPPDMTSVSTLKTVSTSTSPATATVTPEGPVTPFGRTSVFVSDVCRVSVPAVRVRSVTVIRDPAVPEPSSPAVRAPPAPMTSNALLKVTDEAGPVPTSTTSPPLMSIGPGPKGTELATPIRRPPWTSKSSVPPPVRSGSPLSRTRSPAPVLRIVAASVPRTVIAPGLVFDLVLNSLIPAASVVPSKVMVPSAPLVVSL